MKKLFSLSLLAALMMLCAVGAQAMASCGRSWGFTLSEGNPCILLGCVAVAVIATVVAVKKRKK